MRLTCPSCAAVYEVPDASLRPGRRTMCARCGATWLPLRDAEPPPGPRPESTDDAGTAVANAAPPSRSVATSAMDRLAAQVPPTASTALRAAWIGSVLLLVVAVAAAYTWRGGVVHVWPPSGRILGAPAEPPRVEPPPATNAAPPAHVAPPAPPHKAE